MPQKLAAIGHTHLLVRRGTREGRWFANRRTPDGLRLLAHVADVDVFLVTAKTPFVYTAEMTGFSDREYNEQGDRTWRWMGPDASWAIVNTGFRPIVAAIDLEMSAFHHTRRMELRLDGRPAQTLVVDQSHRISEIGPLTVAPGRHKLVFHPADAPTVADEAIHNGDRRPSSFALGRWNWTTRGEQP